MAMKHQDFIDLFIKVKDESDEFGHIIWLPGGKFNGILEGPRTDILSAYLDCAGGYRLQFLTSSPDDRDQMFASLGEFPYHVQKEIINYIKSI